MKLEFYLPRWTKRVSLGSGGRDPLGLSRVAQFLTGELLSGIITTTPRARYYSIYAWILWHIAETEALEVGDWDGFAAALQRREAAFAVVTALDADRRVGVTPVGIRRVRARLEEAREHIELGFRVINHKYGGYGQNYGGSMGDLALWEREQGGFDQVTDDAGALLALAVDEGLASSPYARDRLWEREAVELDALRESVAQMSLDVLVRGGHEDERQALVELFFALDAPVASSEPDRRRRLSLTWVLWVVDRYARAGLTCRGHRHLEWSLLYGPLYFRVMNYGEAEIVTLELPHALREHAEHWRLFCAQQYLTMAHEGALTALLATVAGVEAGLSVAEVVQALVGEGFQAFVDARTGTTDSGPRQVMGALGLDAVPEPSAEGSVNASSRSILHPLSENKLCWEAESSAERLAQSLLLLASLYTRWRVPSSTAAARTLRERAGGEPWVGNRLAWLDSWFAADASWTRAAANLLEALVYRHQEVFWDKRKLDKCWLECVGQGATARVRWVRKLEPSFRNSRFGNAVSILRDLDLLRLGDELSVRESEAADDDDDDDDELIDGGAGEEAETSPPLTSTPRGRALLEQLMAAWP